MRATRVRTGDRVSALAEVLAAHISQLSLHSRNAEAALAEAVRDVGLHAEVDASGTLPLWRLVDSTANTVGIVVGLPIEGRL